MTVACSTEPEAEQTPSKVAAGGAAAAPAVAAAASPAKISDTEVIVFGAPEDAMDWLKAENWWGEFRLSIWIS